MKKRTNATHFLGGANHPREIRVVTDGRDDHSAARRIKFGGAESLMWSCSFVVNTKVLREGRFDAAINTLNALHVAPQQVVINDSPSSYNFPGSELFVPPAGPSTHPFGQMQ